MRHTISRPIDLEKVLHTIHKNLQVFPHYCLLNSNSREQDKPDNYSKYEFLAGVDAIEVMPVSTNSFKDLQTFHSTKKDWLFGYFSYELKDEIEKLSSSNPDRLGFPKVNFFQPRYVLRAKAGMLHVDYLVEYTSAHEANAFVETILREESESETTLKSIQINSQIEKEEYIQIINKIKDHIRRGNIYEINYCTEFFSENVKINPVSVYKRMNSISPMPFSAVYRTDQYFAICCSPERFLANRNNKIISQPIKGTARRNADKEEDERIINQLKSDPKERAENIMIVDLVRNDLSRTSQKGSVQVEELFGISSFRNLHQMISTITSLKRADVNFVDVIRSAFPMGSMTGAPKIRAMELIEELEKNKRGLYSGSIGYIEPDGDFDFNVVIRTVLYNDQKLNLSFMVGSAITVNADPEKEYFECLLKAESMRKALEGY